MSSTQKSADARRVPASEGRDAILKVLDEDGAVIIKGLIGVDEARRINEDITPAMNSHVEGSKLSDEYSQEFHGVNTKRLANMVTLSETFRHALLDNELMHELLEAIFRKESGDYWLNSAQAIQIGPGSKPQPLHRDQWQFPVFTLCGADGPQASVNFIVPLTEFTEENGATRVNIGSHKWENFHDLGLPENTVPLEMELGDAIFITGKVVHGGGANKTKDFYRTGIAMVFQCSYLTPEEAWPFLVDRKLAETLSPRCQRMLGFRPQFPKDCPGVWKCDYSETADAFHGAKK